MRTFFFNTQLIAPKVSLVLLDWSCRESFHILDYLDKQTAPRSQYEVIWIEYYDRKAGPIEEKLKQSESSGAPVIVDRWVALEMPRAVYFHKHLMYNVGIVLSRGRIVVICDSDAMVRETFVESILAAFEGNPQIVLHLDQFRNERRDFYPFSFPSFESVRGEGCLNHSNGHTTGLLDHDDPLHSRNYGACMAALRKDLIDIGGADEHIDYLGHVCGPYDMTFRLVNSGKQEVWHPTEFLYHVWHPGQAGYHNYLGPHDGKQMSTRALETRRTGRVFPYVENPALQMMKLKGEFDFSTATSLLPELVSEETLRTWSTAEIAKRKPSLKTRLISLGSLLINFRLFTTLVKVVARQFWIKLARVPRRVTSPRILLKKIIGVYRFLSNAHTHNLYVMQVARQVFDELAQQGIRKVSIYGTGDSAEILYGLSAEIPLEINAVYDDFAGEKFLGFDVLPIEAAARNGEKIIIAKAAGVEENIARLMKLGVGRERIVVLQ